jgi:tRNA threonylcarbamoyladenosine biosynthesis protein TsaE
LEETKQIAKVFLEKIKDYSSDTALIVGLYGDLGSGKTTFTQDVAKLIGITDFVTSPTYVIEKAYNIKHLIYEKLIHMDLYRIESVKELLNLNWKEIINDPKNLILIEWPEKVSEILPKDHMKINFKFISENKREIEY